MFGGGGGIGGGSGAEAAGRQGHRRGGSGAAVLGAGHSHGGVNFTGPGQASLPLDQQALPAAAFFGQHTGYQQWLPAQFAAQFALGAPGAYGPPHPHTGATFYPPPPHLAAAAAAAAAVAAGQASGATAAEQQAAMAHMHMGHPLPMGLAQPAAQRGWGGMQLQEQPRDPRGGGYGAGRAQRGVGGQPGRSGGGGIVGGGRGPGSGNLRAQGRGRGRRGRGGQPGGDSFSAVEDLLLRIKRLRPDAPLDGDVVRGLAQLDSRGLAQLIKDLGKSNLSHRATQLFDLLRALGPQHELAALLDEFTFTSMISNCVGQQDLKRALQLMEEMRERGIERNVHTFSALMNVCIKCGQYKLALDVYREMRAVGCPANVVTYNTLIDVYGKSGQWEEALEVLSQMKREGVQPVTRTYNTLMIACNTSNQWQEALRVYDELAASGQPPNTTTFNALISAHSKGGDLSKVLAVFKEMVQRGCERSVITYSSLISACEKAGEWELALQLFEEMQQEGCTPNVISFNSLITACAQGAQWEKAAEVFEQMQRQGCRPDVVTFTALIQAYERGGQWRRALAAFEEMRSRPCAPDSIVYNTIIDVLWETGLGWAQRRAAALYRQASREGLIRRHSHVCPESIELNLHSTTAGVALLSLHCWLQDLHQRVATSGPNALPEKICIIAGKGKSKDTGQSIIKEVVAALLRSLRAPFRESADSTAVIGRLEAPGAQVAEWLVADAPTVLSAIIPASSEGASGAAAAAAAMLAPAAASDSAQPADAQQADASEAGTAVASAADAAAAAAAGAGEDGVDSESGHDAEGLEAELSTESRVVEAFKTVKFFEETHCLNLQVMSYGYLQQRPELIPLATRVGAQLALPAETVYDAVLLLDRVMSIPLKAADGLLGVAMAACLLVAAEQSGLGDGRLSHLTGAAQAVGAPADLLTQMRANVLAALSNDTAAISALRCLKLYLERIGRNAGTDAEQDQSTRSPFRLLQETLADGEFLNYRPSVVAAAVLYVERKSRGMAPYWPSALSTLTGYSLQATPELSAAVLGAQRLRDSLQVPAAVWSFPGPAAASSSAAAPAAASAPNGSQGGSAAGACSKQEAGPGGTASAGPVLAAPGSASAALAPAAQTPPAAALGEQLAARSSSSSSVVLPALVVAAARQLPGHAPAPGSPAVGAQLDAAVGLPPP